MADFPALKTGAVMQYPARRSKQFATHIVRFLDGGEQRYRECSGALRRWAIVLDLLDEKEVSALEAFFHSSQGSAGSFSFHDPWDDIDYPDCSLEGDEFDVEFKETGDCATVLLVAQNRS